MAYMYIDRKTTANVILWLAAAGDAETRFPAGQLRKSRIRQNQIRLEATVLSTLWERLRNITPQNTSIKVGKLT